jgi:hypothetical protein
MGGGSARCIAPNQTASWLQAGLCGSLRMRLWLADCLAARRATAVWLVMAFVDGLDQSVWQ